MHKFIDGDFERVDVPGVSRFKKQKTSEKA